MSPVPVGQAYLDVVPRVDNSWRRKIDADVDGATKGITSKFTGAFRGIAVAMGAGAVGGFLKSAIAEAREAQKVTADVNNVIRSTGGAANVSAKDIDRLSSAISRKTGIDDEAIAKGQGMLLTFTKIRNEAGAGNDIFNQASGIMTDLSVKMGKDTPGAAIALGKALNDPILGVTTLTRSGIQFDTQQKAQIKTMVESGDILGAQKVILAELDTQIGGTAEAQATAGEKMKVSWDNLKETLGTALLPILDRVQLALTELFDRFSALSPSTQTAILAVVGITAASVALGIAIAAVASPVTLVVLGIAALAAGAVYAYTHFAVFRTIVDFAWQVLQKFWVLALVMVSPLIGLVAAVIWAYQNLTIFKTTVDFAWQALQGLWNVVVIGGQIAWAIFQFVLSNVINLANLGRTTFGIFAAGVSDAWNLFSTVARVAWDFVRGTVLAPLIWFLDGPVAEGFSRFRGHFETVFGLLPGAASAAWDQVKETFRGGLRFVGDKVAGALTVAAIIADMVQAKDLSRSLGRASVDARNWGMASGGRIGAGFKTDGPRAIVGEGSRSYPEYVIPTDPMYRGNAEKLSKQLLVDLGWAPQMRLGGVLGQIAMAESGYNYRAKNPRSTASGAYQFLDGTWAGYGGYRRAMDAPEHVQDAKALEVFRTQGTRPWNASRSVWSRFAGAVTAPARAGLGFLRDFAGELAGKFPVFPMRGEMPWDVPAGGINMVRQAVIDFIRGRQAEQEGGMGGVGGGPFGDIVAVGRALQRMGYRVGEHPAFGRVGRHAPNSYHYRGRAIDVNADGNEAAKLDAAAAWIRQNVTRWQELIWRQPGHFNHLHLAMAEGGILNPWIRDQGGPLRPGYTLNTTGAAETVVPAGAPDGALDYDLMGAAVADALRGMAFELDAAGIVRLVDQQVGGRADLMARS